MPKTLLVKIDMPITISDLSFASVDDDMLATAGILTKTAEQTVSGIRRYYYVSQTPWRILWVCQTGQPLDLAKPNLWASMLIGWDPGTSRFVPQEAEGKQHSKFTVLTTYQLTDDQVAAMDATIAKLSELIAKAPRSDRSGGSRGGDVGRPRIGDGAISRTVTLSPQQWQKAENIGNGNTSAGLRAAIDAYEERHD